VNSKYIVPAAGFAFLTVVSLLLIVAVVIRPWGGHDRGWATHLNLTDGPLDGYSRNVQTFVSPEGEAQIGVWTRAGCGNQAAISTDKPTYDNIPIKQPACTDEPIVEWMAQGCAGCHGLDGTGGAVGPNLQELPRLDFADQIRFGPKGMPAFHQLDLSDEQIQVIADYLVQVGGPAPTVTPVPPTPTPLPPTPTAVPPTPGPTEVASGGTPEATSVVAAPTPVPSPAPDSLDAELIAAGKLLFEKAAGIKGCAECHGFKAEGGGPGASNAPSLFAPTRSDIRAALSGATDMTDIKLTSSEIEALVAYLEVIDRDG